MSCLDYDIFLNSSAKKMPGSFQDAISACTYSDETSMGAPKIAIKRITYKLRDGTAIALGEDVLQENTGALTDKSYQSVLESIIWSQHRPPLWEEPSGRGRTKVIETTGGTDNNMQVIQAICEPGDGIIVEDHTYTGTLTISRGRGLRVHPVKLDDSGMDPKALEETLARWDPDSRPGENGKPKLIFVIPNGQNPTGYSYTLERKRRIYEIARRYNLMILEDDAYFFLQFGERAPSFLSLDVDGRVIRNDTFSKSLFPGLRAAYMTGPAEVLDVISRRLEGSTEGTTPLTKKVVVALFAHWGITGFLRYQASIASMYRRRRDILIDLMDKHLKDLADYRTPSSGMFIWTRIKGCSDTVQLIDHCLKKGVSASPGQYFSPQDEKSPFLRISYSNIPIGDMEEGVKKLASCIREFVKQDVPPV